LPKRHLRYTRAPCSGRILTIDSSYFAIETVVFDATFRLMTTLRLHCRAAVAASAVAVGLLAVPAPAQAQEPVLVIDGRGWGHGVGMSQEGARTMGGAGSSTEQILAKFYPGTVKGSARGDLRVVVLESAQGTETLSFPGGGEIRAMPTGGQPEGFPVIVQPGGRVDIIRDQDGYRVGRATPTETAAPAPLSRLRLISSDAVTSSPIATLPTAATATTTTTLTGTTSTTTASSTTTTLAATMSTTATTAGGLVTPPASRPPSSSPAQSAPSPAATPSTTVPTTAVLPRPGPTEPGPFWAVPREGQTVATSRGRRYRGAIEVAAGAGGRLRMVNHVDVESYLRGMGEVLDPGWPPAALRAQAIAARTYALRTAGAELCDDDRCQVYLGQSAEYPAMDKAVADTRQQVLLYGGQLASTFYSANAGGISATAEEGFGKDGATYPYLTSEQYPSADPDPWTERPGLAEVAQRTGYSGQLAGARITSAGPSGRAIEVTLDGDAGAKAVDGRTFASQLGLRSTLFALRSAVGEAVPLPAIPSTAVVAQELAPAEGTGAGVGDQAIALAPPPAPGSWLRRQVPRLLLLLFADVLLLCSRPRWRARLAIVLAEVRTHALALVAHQRT